jgi:glycosyltransferase involved in cell wall biosynthesis
MIFFDGIVFRISPQAGISRIYKELWMRWEKVNSQGIVFIPSETLFPVKEGLDRINYSGLRPRRLFWKKEMIRAFHRVKPDFFISTYYTKSPNKKIDEIVVIPDMIDEVFVDSPWSNHTLVSRKTDLAHRAKIIIAISNTTKEDVLSFYQFLPESCVKVIHLAASEIFKPEEESELNSQYISKPYILYVGSRRNYKNFLILLKAYSNNPKLNKHYDLVVIDKSKWQEDEIEIINYAKLSDKVHLKQNVSDKELVQYYQSARVFVFPSKYEGFGIPLLESAACGTPVIANASASLVEIGEDAVLYFSDPDEQSSLSTQLEKICFDDALHQEYSIKGINQSAKFSWDKFAEQFNETICSL